MENIFKLNIEKILEKYFGDSSKNILNESQLLQYIVSKTQSINENPKSRSSYGNLYAIYVIVEDYIKGDFHKNNAYSNYEGAKFSSLQKRQRELPFGSKLQNHSLNHRVNSEFQKFFPNSEIVPVVRDLIKERYWVNERLLLLNINGKNVNIAEALIDIIDNYIELKQKAFNQFIIDCENLKSLQKNNSSDIEVNNFINKLLSPESDARLFEIVSYAILKYFYQDQIIYWGYNKTNLKEENLKLYKTGRTNANDGGNDFVMKPLGKFFQVTESLDFKKYFLDIEKVQKYPIVFVIKSNESIEKIKNDIEQKAYKIYSIESVVKSYLECIEEIINVPILQSMLSALVKKGYLNNILNEIISQSRVEFNIDF